MPDVASKLALPPEDSLEVLIELEKRGLVRLSEDRGGGHTAWSRSPGRGASARAALIVCPGVWRSRVPIKGVDRLTPSSSATGRPRCHPRRRAAYLSYPRWRVCVIPRRRGAHPQAREGDPDSSGLWSGSLPGGAPPGMTRRLRRGDDEQLI